MRPHKKFLISLFAYFLSFTSTLYAAPHLPGYQVSPDALAAIHAHLVIDINQEAATRHITSLDVARHIGFNILDREDGLRPGLNHIRSRHLLHSPFVPDRSVFRTDSRWIALDIIRATVNNPDLCTMTQLAEHGIPQYYLEFRRTFTHHEAQHYIRHNHIGFELDIHRNIIPGSPTNTVVVRFNITGILTYDDSLHMGILRSAYPLV